MGLKNAKLNRRSDGMDGTMQGYVDAAHGDTKAHSSFYTIFIINYETFKEQMVCVYGTCGIHPNTYPYTGLDNDKERYS